MPMNGNTFGTGSGGNNPAAEAADANRPNTNPAPKPPSQAPAAPVKNDPNCGYGYPYKRV